MKNSLRGGIVRIDTQDPIEAARRISEVIRGARSMERFMWPLMVTDLGGILSFVAHRGGCGCHLHMFGESAVRLPPLKMDISDTKLRILEALEEESLNAVLLSRKVGISRAMVYKHLSALMDMGLVKQSQMFERYSITGAGKLVII